MDGDGRDGVVGDADGQAETEQEVSGRQVLQVERQAAGYPMMSSAEVKLHGEAVEK